MGDLVILPGDPLPLGVHRRHQGLNFAVFSRRAESVELLLFECADETEPTYSISLDPRHHRTGDIWHVTIGTEFSQRFYALRVNDGPTLLDPYATALTNVGNWKMSDASRRDAGPRPKCVLAPSNFDWQGVLPPRHTWGETIIYEAHVRGLTVHPSSGAVFPGQYHGVVEKIPYFQSLGITALELMPVQDFSEHDTSRRDPAGRILRNYWGYNPVSLFAPKESYAGDGPPGRHVDAFKTMVRELHRAGIEVILDVVFTHTAEGGAGGAPFSFRGLDDAVYYIHTPDGGYADYSGCGNALNCNHPVIRSMLVDCLRHWVIAMHIDGFRFDLASILGRDDHGALLTNPPVLEQIAEDPLLREVKLIAEAWDAGGAFQVGSFPGTRWAEWNSDFRDDVRRFWRGDPGFTGRFATRLCGSADLYQMRDESPVNSINYVTCHDGFTLADLVSYARKHNEANGEDNRDGPHENYSENNWAEGKTDNPRIETTRLRQIKNFLASLLLSRGVPMLLGGDEFRRSQSGNNNAYCQDNPASWFDWALTEKNAGLVRFVRRLIAFRKEHSVLRAERFYMDRDITWYGPDGSGPDWQSPDNMLGCVLWQKPPERILCLLFNATLNECGFTVPACPSKSWMVAFDTALAAPADSPDPGTEPVLNKSSLVLGPRSLVVLAAL
jgi:glycogen operon protein